MSDHDSDDEINEDFVMTEHYYSKKMVTQSIYQERKYDHLKRLRRRNHTS